MRDQVRQLRMSQLLASLGRIKLWTAPLIRLEAVMTAWDSIVLALLFAASAFPLSCLIFDHRLWPESRSAELDHNLAGT